MINRDKLTGEIKVDNKEKLTFGKYKGRTLSTIMITDPQYLMWVVNDSDSKYNISDFNISENILINLSGSSMTDISKIYFLSFLSFA